MIAMQVVRFPRSAMRATTIGCLLVALLLISSAVCQAVPQSTAPQKAAGAQQAEDPWKSYAPVILGFIAAWITVGPIFTLLERLHGLRDKVILGPEVDKFRVRRDIDIKYREAMLRNSYKPILYGWLVFFLLVFVFAVAITAMVNDMFFRLVAAAVALQYMLTFIGFLKGGLADMTLMEEAIKDARKPEPIPTAHEPEPIPTAHEPVATSGDTVAPGAAPAG